MRRSYYLTLGCTVNEDADDEVLADHMQAEQPTEQEVHS